MNAEVIPFQITDWQKLPAAEHPGETGTAWWRTRQFGPLRVRMVECSPNYLADQWCQKGHILFVFEGEFQTHLGDGQVVTLTPGMSYEVSDGLSSHRSMSRTGAKLFVVDGDFLAAPALELN